MNYARTTRSVLAAALATTAVLAAQEPAAGAPPAPPPAVLPAPAGDTWSEGFARAGTYRAAIAQALEDAVAKVRGVAIARGPEVRSRLTIVGEHKDGERDGWFDGTAEGEREWVQQQVAGFVVTYEVQEKKKADDRQWEVRVRALVAGHDRFESALVIDLTDGEVRKWQLDRYEEGGVDRPFAQKTGEFQGPRIADYLRSTGAVQILADRSAADRGQPAGASARERDKAGRQLVASHRVTVEWQPVLVQSVVERSNPARPTSGPRPEYLSGGSVAVALRIVDVVHGTELLSERFAVGAEPGATMPVERIDAYVTALVDRAKAQVAQRLYFALRPPVVLRKWAGEGGAWFVEARFDRRVAVAFPAFAIGLNGSLAAPDWQSLGAATFVGGTSTTCTFRLEGPVDVTRIEVGAAEVRPAQD
jgi:hypothetical protein